MPDFPGGNFEFPVSGTIHSSSLSCATCNQGEFIVANYALAATVANQAVYIPFTVDYDVNAQQMFCEAGGTVTGTTVDLGIYDALGNRLVSAGPTLPTVGATVLNTTDTVLVPGQYFMGFVASSATPTYWSLVLPVVHLRACGVMEQAVGSATLPNPATFAVATHTFLPLVGISLQSVM